MAEVGYSGAGRTRVGLASQRHARRRCAAGAASCSRGNRCGLQAIRSVTGLALVLGSRASHSDGRHMHARTPGCGALPVRVVSACRAPGVLLQCEWCGLVQAAHGRREAWHDRGMCTAPLSRAPVSRTAPQQCAQCPMPGRSRARAHDYSVPPCCPGVRQCVGCFCPLVVRPWSTTVS